MSKECLCGFDSIIPAEEDFNNNLPSRVLLYFLSIIDSSGCVVYREAIAFCRVDKSFSIWAIALTCKQPNHFCKLLLVQNQPKSPSDN